MARGKRRAPGDSENGSSLHKRPRQNLVSASGRYYGVRGGRQGFSGVVSTWEECSSYVTGIPDALYKSFDTYAEADDFADRNGTGASLRHVPNFRVRYLFKNVERPTVLQAKTSEDTDDPLLLCVFVSGKCVHSSMLSGTGGYGVFFGQHNPYNYSGRMKGHVTTNSADLRAVSEAVSIVSQHSLVADGGVLVIVTDSQFVKNGIDHWMETWKRNNWETVARTPIPTKSLWQDIDASKVTLVKKNIRIHVVRAKHGGKFPGLRAASELATLGAQSGSENQQQ